MTPIGNFYEGGSLLGCYWAAALECSNVAWEVGTLVEQFTLSQTLPLRQHCRRTSRPTPDFKRRLATGNNGAAT